MGILFVVILELRDPGFTITFDFCGSNDIIQSDMNSMQDDRNCNSLYFTEPPAFTGGSFLTLNYII